MLCRHSSRSWTIHLLKTRSAPAPVFSSVFTKASSSSSPPVLANWQRLAQNESQSTGFKYTLVTQKMINGSHYSRLECRNLSYSHCNFSTHQNDPSRKYSPWKLANRNTVIYMIALAITVTGLSYAAVPLYRLFCQASGYGGTVVKGHASDKVEKMEPIRERELTVRYG